MSTPDGRSLGAFRVRESFNPSESNMVDKIKRFTADLIDLCQELEKADAAYPSAGEQTRLCRLAMTAYEEAAMWAVKAATTVK
jgi:cyanophycinase-like exopeptidase